MVQRLTGSVRVRVTVMATVLVAVVLTSGAFLLTRAVEHRLIDERRQTAANAVGTAISSYEGGTPLDQLPLGPAPDGAMVSIIDARTGDPIGTSTPAPATLVISRTGGSDPTAASGGGIVSFPGSMQGFTTVTNIIDSSSGKVLVVGSASLSTVGTSVDTLWSGLRLGIPAVVAAAALASWFLAGRALRPVELMRLEVESISSSTLDRRLPEPSSHDEVARLARTMNSMLARLHESRDHERRFVSDASHELRSPLASMRAQLDIGEWPPHADGVRAEAVRLSHIVDDLMDLAKADEEAPTSTSSDLDDLVFEEAASLARTSQVRIDTTRVGAARLCGDRPALARLVRNLVENATSHAQTTVQVSLTSTDEHITLCVDDDGRGVEPCDRERIFERFARADDSRSRDTGGVGLGLAVVRATAARHRGTVQCEPSPLGGARFVVTLPGGAPG
ncbi:MAG: sensor histidine kinase [Acidimicrobiia bacterium]